MMYKRTNNLLNASTANLESRKMLASFTLADADSTPLDSAVYNSDTGVLDLSFDSEKILEGDFFDARLISAFQFGDTIIELDVHPDDGPRDENGRYIFDESTIIDDVSLDVGDLDVSGEFEFRFTQFADGRKGLFNVQMEESEVEVDEDEVDEETSSEDAISLLDVDSTPLEEATYNPETGLLDLVFSYDKVLNDSDFENARHIDAFIVNGDVHEIELHADDGPRDENGFIYDETTVENEFTVDIGDQDISDGLEVVFTDRADGTRSLYAVMLG